MRVLIAVLLVFAFLPHVAAAQIDHTLGVESNETHIDAEEISYDKQTDTIVARGNVVITRGAIRLEADEVRVNRTTNEADALGNVHLDTPEGTVVAEAIHLNLDDETGLLARAQVTSRRTQYSLVGDRIEKGFGQSYRIENGTFTTCHCAEGPASWSVSGKELQITLGGYGRLQGGTFNVLNCPVLYIPRAIFPAQRERQTGFLLPRFGVSNVRGFQTLLPFYWVIDKSQDATFALDLETSARIGLVGEYRYAASRDTRGILTASYFNESIRGAAPTKPFETTVPEQRWSAAAEHTQGLTEASRAYADVFLVSDDLFLREINTYAFEHAQDVNIRSLPFTQSKVGATQQWDRVAVKAEGTYYQNLTGSESPTLQRAPELDAWAQALLGTHILGDLNASAVDFQRGSGVDGLRLDVAPGATLPLPLGNHAFGGIHASFRETAYQLIESKVTNDGPTLPSRSSRELFQLNGEVGSTIDRVYSVNWMGLEKLKHTIEPGLAYLYIPAVTQADLPLFDGVDRVEHRNLVTYGFASRFIGKFAADPPAGEAAATANAPAPSIRELGRFSIAQSFDVSREIGQATGRMEDHFSDIDIDARANPSRVFSMSFHANYNTGITDITAARVGILLQDPRSLPSATDPHRLAMPTSAAVSYRFLTQNQLQEVDDTLTLRLTRWAGFQYASRYNIVTNRFLDNHFGLRLSSTCDCWALDIGVTNRTNPQETEVRAQVTLVGLGSTVSRP
jgi:LPS-assembly protein